MHSAEWVSVVLSHAAAGALYAAAGGAAFLFLVGRHLLHIRRARVKLPALLAAFGGLLLAPAWFGATRGWDAWALLPAAALAAFAAAEIPAIALRARLRAAPPRPPHAGRLLRPVTTTDIEIARCDWECPGWHGPAFRVALVSDLHVGPALPDSYFRKAARLVNDAEPDLLFMAGDFVTRSAHVDRLPEILALFRARLGAWAVLGNHDLWADPGRVAAAVARSGARLLRDTCETVELARGRAVTLCGCEAPWGGSRWLPPPPPPEHPLLVLSHSPDNVHRLARTGAAAVFSGHMHGGQFRLPWIGPLLLPSRHGRMFDHGHFRIGNTHLFVSRGVGVANPPLRLYCPPDILLADARGA